MSLRPFLPDIFRIICYIDFKYFGNAVALLQRTVVQVTLVQNQLGLFSETKITISVCISDQLRSKIFAYVYTSNFFQEHFK